VNTRDAGSGAFWLLVGAGVAWAGWDLELGSVRDPGSGFLLFWVGVLMTALSAGVVVMALRAPRPAARDSSNVSWTRVAGVIGALVVYAWLLPRAGFLVTTTVVMLGLFKAVEPRRWVRPVASALVSAAAAYVVFKVWLGAQLPGGPFGLG
jgi:putative tricarboxylic transport membrane protein